MDTTEKKTPVSATGPAVTRVALALVFSAGEVVTPPLRFRPGREALVIGRETSRGLALPTDPRASRRHASVFEGPDGSLHLVDESSTNGTWVNGGRVDETDLVEGDVITVGDSLLVVGAEPEGPGEAEPLGLIGSSEALRRLRSKLAHAAPGGAPLLLLGDTGCGEEIAARALHALSGRQGPFVAVNCGARPEGLTEAQLFGHESASFGTARRGLFGDAEGGTLFLNEIGELNPALQSKLLRALRERLTLPVGATAPRPCDVRVVAATDRALVGSGRAFLGELYTHLTERTLHIPPLRERREDVLALLAHALGTASPKLEVELAERLLLYDWPYNIRELRSLAKQLLIRSGEGPYELDPVEGQLTPRPRRVTKERPPADLPTLPAIPALRALAARETLPPRASPPRDPPSSRGTTARYGFITAEFPAIVATQLSAVDVPPESDAGRENAGSKGRDPPPGRAQLEALLRRHSGVVSEVARAVSRSRKQVYRWLEHHGLDAEAFRRLGPGRKQPRRQGGPCSHLAGQDKSINQPGCFLPGPGPEALPGSPRKWLKLLAPVTCRTAYPGAHSRSPLGWQGEHPPPTAARSEAAQFVLVPRAPTSGTVDPFITQHGRVAAPRRQVVTEGERRQHASPTVTEPTASRCSMNR